MAAVEDSSTSLSVSSDAFGATDHYASSASPSNASSAEVVCRNPDATFDVVHSVICGGFIFLGLVYAFFGYRCFKASMFFLGFLIGALILFSICSQQDLLSAEGNYGVAAGAGFLCGLITMLVTYVGLFVVGLLLGILLGVGGLLVLVVFYEPATVWVTLGLLFGTGLLFAVLALYFQKGLTIASTSILGSALVAVGVDHFVEFSFLRHFLWDVITVQTKKYQLYSPSSFTTTSPSSSTSADTLPPLSGLPRLFCWFTWVVLATWPTLFLLGILVQSCVTGKKYDHRKSDICHRLRVPAPKPESGAVVASLPSSSAVGVGSTSGVNLPKSPKSPKRPKDKHRFQPVSTRDSLRTPGHCDPNASDAKFRHLYRMRRADGDIISREYIQSISAKSPGAASSCSAPGGPLGSAFARGEHGGTRGSTSATGITDLESTINSQRSNRSTRSGATTSLSQHSMTTLQSNIPPPFPSLPCSTPIGLEDDHS